MSDYKHASRTKLVSAFGMIIGIVVVVNPLIFYYGLLLVIQGIIDVSIATRSELITVNPHNVLVGVLKMLSIFVSGFILIFINMIAFESLKLVVRAIKDNKRRAKCQENESK